MHSFRTPSLRRHKPSSLGVVILIGKDVYLGPGRKSGRITRQITGKISKTHPDFGRTLLMLAVGVDDGLELVRFLIENGADVNRADTSGRYTALHLAVIDFRKEVIRTLLGAGAAPNAQDASGWTPLRRLLREPDLKVVLALDLVQHGADPDRRDGPDVSPREEAERAGLHYLFRSAELPKRNPKPKGRVKRGPPR